MNLRFAVPLSLLAIAFMMRMAVSSMPATGQWEGGTPASETVRTLALDDSKLLAGTLNGLYVSADGGQSWQAVPELAGLRVDALAVEGGNAFAAGPATMWRRAGTEWRALEPSPGGIAYDLTMESGRLLEAAEVGLFELTVTASSGWRRVWPLPGDAPERVFSVIADGGYLLLGTEDGVVQVSNHDWKRLGPAGRSVRGVAAGDSWIHAAVDEAGNGPSRARMGLYQWEKGNVEIHGAATVLVDSGNSSHVYVGLRGLADGQRIAGVAISRDSGATWATLGSRLVNMAVHDLALDSKAGVLYAATDGAGVFRYGIPSRVQEILTDVQPAADLLEPALLGWLALALLRRPARRRAPAPKGPRSHPTT